MKRIDLIVFILLTSLSMAAQEWDEALYQQIEQSIRVPQFADEAYDITRFGAKPSAAAAKNQKAIQKAIDKCAKKGGGRVVVPAGQTFLTGAITLKSGVNLEVQEGATLQFAFEPNLYPVVETSWEGLECFNLSPCIYAFNQHDIAITGKGTIDGGGSTDTWWPWCGSPKYGAKPDEIGQNHGSRARLLKNGEDGIPMYDEKGRRSPERVFGPQDGLRPQLINFNKCERILMEDVTLLRSPFWVIHPLQSTDITIRRVKMINNGPNGDGCDPECCNRVLIEDCFFNTGDDCIAIKSGRNRDGRSRNIPSQNIIVRHCEMHNGHGGVVIGSEISGGARNIFAHDCVMDSPQLERVLRIKTNSCRGGVIENVSMKDIKVGVCKEAVLKINLDYEHNEVCERGHYPTVRNIYMENVTSRQSKYATQIIGLDEGTYVENIHLNNCRFDGVKSGNYIVGRAEKVRFHRVFINDSLVLTHLPFQYYSEWMTRSEMKRTPQSYLLDFSSKPKWSYVMGIELESMLDTYLAHGGDDILRYCQQYIDTMITADGTIRGYNLLDYNLDNIRTGHFLTRMYQLNPESKNLMAIHTLMQQLQNQPRTKNDRVFWHKAIYAYQVWLDGIFMGLPFRCLTAATLNASTSTLHSSRFTSLPLRGSQRGLLHSSLFTSLPLRGSQRGLPPSSLSTSLPPEGESEGAVSPTAIYNDAVNQLLTTYERTLDPETRLNRHAYDETRKTFWADPQTGLSQHCWARAQGWFTMALIEILDALPQNYARRDEVIALLQKDLDAVIKWQDQESGVWYQVMDSPGQEGNYLESTASSMFAYTLLKAYRKGYLDTRYRDAGIKAYKGILRHFIRINADQTISLTQCCSVAGLGPAATPEVKEAMQQYNPQGSLNENRHRDGSYEYYLSEPIRDNDPKGIGPFIWASLEMEKLGVDDLSSTSHSLNAR